MALIDWRTVDSYSVACPKPKCGSEKKKLCRNPSGGYRTKAHTERAQAARKEAEDKARKVAS